MLIMIHYLIEIIIIKNVKNIIKIIPKNYNDILLGFLNIKIKILKKLLIILIKSILIHHLLNYFYIIHILIILEEKNVLLIEHLLESLTPPMLI
jgi:hypothetical protein